MCDVLQAAVDNGAGTLNIPDTVGYATPHEWAERMVEVPTDIESEFKVTVEQLESA